MTIKEIKEFPTTIGHGVNGQRIHESVLRGYQILEKTKDLLRKDTPPSVILEIIEEIELSVSKTKEI